MEKTFSGQKKTRAPVVLHWLSTILLHCFYIVKTKATDGMLPTTNNFEVAMDRYYELFPQHTSCFKFPTDLSTTPSLQSIDEFAPTKIFHLEIQLITIVMLIDQEKPVVDWTALRISQLD